mmetsp:Transcript_42824/g.69606  ORF Transcript_42824/g.69606 Transcript_42824/m.69606 type:complete len:93 (+) Transcript_42824:151-429(+)
MRPAFRAGAVATFFNSDAEERSVKQQTDAMNIREYTKTEQQLGDACFCGTGSGGMHVGDEHDTLRALFVNICHRSVVLAATSEATKLVSLGL